MNLTLSVPSKTFLVGEYAVLAKGKALVVNTAPRFELRVHQGSGGVQGIPAGSPAARWLEQRRPLLNNWDIEFVDPHLGLGGLGASGAQFLTVHALTTYLQSSFERSMRGPVLQDVWNDFQVLGSGSGADLLAQASGFVSEIDMGARSVVATPWPYEDIGFTIVRTHQKVPTHEHLEKVDREALTLLIRPAAACVEAFGRARSEVFVGLLREFAQRLKEVDLQAPSTQALVNMLESENWCLAAKGCGALGADTVLFLYPIGERERVSAFLKKARLQAVASHGDLSGGLEVRWSG